jgi:hypothetical protein
MAKRLDQRAMELRAAATVKYKLQTAAPEDRARIQALQQLDALQQAPEAYPNTDAQYDVAGPHGPSAAQIKRALDSEQGRGLDGSSYVPPKRQRGQESKEYSASQLKYTNPIEAPAPSAYRDPRVPLRDPGVTTYEEYQRAEYLDNVARAAASGSAYAPNLYTGQVHPYANRVYSGSQLEEQQVYSAAAKESEHNEQSANETQHDAKALADYYNSPEYAQWYAQYMQYYAANVANAAKDNEEKESE